MFTMMVLLIFPASAQIYVLKYCPLEQNVLQFSKINWYQKL